MTQHKNGIVDRREPVMVDRRGIPIHRLGASPVELAYVTRDSRMTPTLTVRTSAQFVLQTDPLYSDGTKLFRFEFYCSAAQCYPGISVALWNETTSQDLGILCKASCVTYIAFAGLFGFVYYQPPLGTYRFSARAWADSIPSPSTRSSFLASASDGLGTIYLRVTAA